MRRWNNFSLDMPPQVRDALQDEADADGRSAGKQLLKFCMDGLRAAGWTESPDGQWRKEKAA